MKMAFLAVIWLLALPAIADENNTPLILSGQAQVADGDSLRLSNERIRLFGIDAPELDQSCKTEQGVTWPCGKWVKGVLVRYIKGREVACYGLERDRYRRLVAQCFVGGVDIGGWLVENGLAFAYRKYSLKYVDEEARARARDLGMWVGAAQAPQQFRLAAQKSEPPPNKKCAIKGNISKNGRIFHVPGSRWYSRTKIDTSRGERWFCSVKDAIEAGWRAPRG